MAHLLIVEGNLPEDELAVQRALGATPAQRLAQSLGAVRPDLAFSFANPWFSNHSADAIPIATFAGMIAIGGLVPWSVADDRAQPMGRMFETAFAAGVPVFATGWAMQAAAAILGGTVGPAQGGAEVGIARALQPTDHPMMAGRRSSFDAISLHNDSVLSAPPNAVVTASNPNSPIQALSVVEGKTNFTGTQYQPEMSLAELAVLMGKGGRSASRINRAAARDFQAVASDPAMHPRLCAKYRIGVDILDRAYHQTELRSWVIQTTGAITS